MTGFSETTTALEDDPLLLVDAGGQRGNISTGAAGITAEAAARDARRTLKKSGFKKVHARRLQDMRGTRKEVTRLEKKAT